MALAGCQTTRVATPIDIPDERIDCTELESGRPVIPPEYVIDWQRFAERAANEEWSAIQAIEAARIEHRAFVTRLRLRETPISGYVVALEGRVFACSNDAAWMRDFKSRLPAPE